MLHWQLIHFVRLFMDKMDSESINHNSIYLYFKDFYHFIYEKIREESNFR